MSDFVRQYEQFPLAAKLAGAMMLIGATGYYAWGEYITPKLVIIAEKTENQNKIEDELKQLNRDFVSPVTLEEELAAANREFKRLVELLPQDSSVDRVLNDFASISRVTGTEIREFVPSAELTAPITPQANGQLPVPVPIPAPQNNANNANNANNQPKTIIELEETNAVSLQLRMFGTFPALVSFLDMSMSIPRVVRLQEFEIINSDRDLKLIQKPKLTFSGLFYAYYQKPGSPSNSTTAEATSNDKSKSPTAAIGKPVIDLNEVIDKSYSAKPLNGGAK